MWSRKYEKCIICGTVETKHHSKGMCKKCYNKKWQEDNPEKNKETMSKYYRNNSEKIKEQNRRWQKENPRKVRDLRIKWRKNNFEKIKEYQKKIREQDIEGWRIKEREKKKIWRENNPEKAREQTRLASKRYYDKNKKKIYFRNFNNVQRRIKTAVSKLIGLRLKKRLSSKKGKSTFSFLPYTADDLIKHLEKQFEPWMNWNNWGKGSGKWNIDHIRPDCSFDYKSVNDEEFQKCWALNNLRPLEATENIRKNGKT